MKKKKYKISEFRILDISNDISQEMCAEGFASQDELVEVVRFWRDQYDALFQKAQLQRSKAAITLLKVGEQFLKPWA